MSSPGPESGRSIVDVADLLLKLTRTVDTLTRTVETLRTDVNTKLDFMALRQGALIRSTLAAAADASFGRGYSSSSHLRSLSDLASFFPDEAFGGLIPKREHVFYARQEMCEMLAEHLLGSNVPLALLQAIMEKQPGGAELGWTEQGTVQIPALERCIGSCEEGALKEALTRLKLCLETTEREEALQALQDCKGPGIMCLVFAATRRADDALDHQELQFDTKARISVVTGSAFVDIGEMYSSPNHSMVEAVQQLALRLTVLRHVIHLVTKMPAEAVELVGRIFALRGLSEHAGLGAYAQELGYNLDMHVV